MEKFNISLTKLKDDFKTVNINFQKRLVVLNAVPTKDSIFDKQLAKHLSKHSSVNLIYDNSIKKYELVIKELGGQI